MSDRLDFSTAVAAALLIFTISAVAAVVLHSALQPVIRGEDHFLVFKALGVSAPALYRSGRPERVPEAIDSMTDLRHTPLLYVPEPDPAGLVFNKKP